MGRAEVGGRPVIPEVIEVEPNRFRSDDHLFYEGLVSDPTQGRYRVDGGDWVPIPDTLTVAGTPVDLQVLSATPHLVG